MSDRDVELALRPTLRTPAADDPTDALDEALRSPEIARARARAKAGLFGGTVDPVRIDRFLVARRIGGGGMGVVYAAYDPKLDRKVAIKLLRADASLGEDAGHQRLTREAQAMAQVTHPNVITVHEVGAYEGQVFVAMEFIDGATLTDWLEQAPRSWAEIRAAFEAVARGLIAAHRAGLVHRDFKPDNVMLGADERVIVLDFGLAKPVGEQGPDTGPASQAPDQAIRARMTQTGAVLGTPAYMAPEQHLAGTVDARADQFSYCVALFEAVYGRRPHPAETYDELVTAVTEGKVEQPDDRGDVPLRAYRAMLRGLAPDPDDRFADMESLLPELLHDPSGQRRRFVLTAASALVIIGAGAALLGLSKDADCEQAEAALASAWNSTTKERARAAFEATGKPYAADAWDTVAQTVDRYARSWSEAHEQVCGRDTLQPRERALGILCLRWRVQEVEALAGLFARADGGLVEQAVEAASAITPAQQCLSAASSGAVRLPEDPDLRAAVVEARGRLAHAKGVGDAGLIEEAIELVETLRGGDAAQRFAPLQAAASLRLGRLQRATRDLDAATATLTDAVYQGLGSEHDDAALAAATELVWVAGVERADFEAALPWVRLAEALARRSDDPIANGRLDVAQGAAFAAVGRRPEARERFAAAALGLKDAPDELVTALVWLGSTEAADGDAAAGLASLERARDVAAGARGETHPETAQVDVRIGNVLWARGRYPEAKARYKAALDVEQAARGQTHPAIAAPLAGLARTAWALNRGTEALETVDRILEIERSERVQDEALVAALEVQANLLAERGKLRPAEAAIDQALAVARRRGEAHPLHAFAFAAQGEVHRRAGRHNEALRYLERAATLAGPQLGPDDPRRLELTVATGRALVDAEQAAKAIDPLDAALTALTGCCSNHFRIPDAQIALAQALRERDPARAKALAQDAQRRFESVGREADARAAASVLTED